MSDKYKCSVCRRYLNSEGHCIDCRRYQASGDYRVKTETRDDVPGQTARTGQRDR